MKTSFIALLGASVVMLSQAAFAGGRVDEQLVESNTGFSVAVQVGELASKHNLTGSARVDHMSGLRVQGGIQRRFYLSYELSYLERDELLEDASGTFKISTSSLVGKFGKGFAPLPELQLIPYGSAGYRRTDLEIEAVSHYELGAGLLTQALFKPAAISLDVGLSAAMGGRVKSFGESADVPENPVFSSKITADVPVGSQHHILVGLDYHRYSYEVDGARLKFRDPTFFIGYRWGL